MKKHYLLFGIILQCISVYCQTPNWLWAKTTNCGIQSYGYSGYYGIENISTDKPGYIYVSGVCDSCLLGNTIINPNSNSHFFAKYDSLGDVKWAKPANNFTISKLKTDSTGNIFICGTIGDTAIFDNDTIIGPGIGFFIAKYNSSGHEQWVRRVTQQGGQTYYHSTFLTLDATDNVFITGSFFHTLNFGNIVLTDTISGDIYIAKYDSSGNILWANGIGTKYSIEPFTITSDNLSNLFITGLTGFNNQYTTIGNDTLYKINGKNFIAKFDSSGNPLWAKNFNISTYYTRYWGSEADKHGNYYFTGSYPSSNPTLSFGNITLNGFINGGSNQLFLVKFDPNGNDVWAKTSLTNPISGSNNANIIATDLVNDRACNIYITGTFYSSILGNDTIISFGNGAHGNGDIFIVKYDSSGNELWAKSAGGDSTDWGYSIASDKSENIYVGGNFISNSVAFGSTTLYNSHPGWGYGLYDHGLQNIFLAKLSSSVNTGIQNIKNEEVVLIYPNPTSSSFKIKLPPNSRYIKIYNSLGQEIQNLILKNKTDETLEISENGVYIVQVVTEREVITRKVVVEN